MAHCAPQLKPVRLPEARKQQPDSEISGAAASSPPTPPAAAGAGGAALLSAQPSSDLLPCGLFEDELHELDELLQSHSPKNASPIAATQLK